MERIALLFILLASFINCLAQDTIIKKDGSSIVCKVIEVSDAEVIYKRWSDLQGPNYVMERSVVANINYQNGRQDKLNEQTSNKYAPGIQQTGEAQYNDNALLALDYHRNNKDYKKKYKKLTTIGWTVGGLGVGVGSILMIISGTVGSFTDANIGIFAGGAFLFLGGLGTATGCLISAHKIKKEGLMYSVCPLIHHQFNLSNGKSLITGVDLIQDKYLKRNVLGFGVQYNF